MNIIINKDGFLLYATAFEVPSGELSTNVSLPSNLVKPKFVNGTWIEGSTQQELTDLKAKKTLDLHNEYAKKIDELVFEYVQKKIIDGTEIPQSILNAREALKAEHNNKLLLL